MFMCVSVVERMTMIAKVLNPALVENDPVILTSRLHAIDVLILCSLGLCSLLCGWQHLCIAVMMLYLDSGSISVLVRFCVVAVGQDTVVLPCSCCCSCSPKKYQHVPLTLLNCSITVFSVTFLKGGVRACYSDTSRALSSLVLVTLLKGSSVF